MATLERIHFTPHNVGCINKNVTYTSSNSRPFLDGLPQIFWADFTPWREANLWALERATSGESSLKTISGNMNGLLNYAKFLESHDLHWLQFPSRKSERCLVLYRGALIKIRNAGLSAPLQRQNICAIASCSIGG